MKYYYLISSLPDLDPDVALKAVDFDDVFETIARNLEPIDLRDFHYLLYPNDNRNLLNQIFLEYKDLPPSKFLKPGVLDEEVIASYKREQSIFPDYMVNFLLETEPQFTILSMSEIEQRLQTTFWEQVHKEATNFIRQYFTLNQALAAITAAMNKAKYDFLPANDLPENNAFLEGLAKGHAVSSMVLKRYPYAEQLKEVLSLQNPMAIERFTLEITWTYLDEVQQDFEVEQVLAYTAKALLLNRKKAQNMASGLSRFNALTDEIKNMVHSPKTPVV